MVTWAGDSNSGVIKINKEEIRKLKHQALAAPLKRARLCLHKGKDDSLQEMIIVLCKDSYVMPHAHKGKDESLSVLEGSFYLVIFDEHGRVIEKIILRQHGQRSHFLCRVKESVWHTVVPLSDFVVIHEIIKGPFKGGARKKNAPWVPQKKDEIKNFIHTVVTRK